MLLFLRLIGDSAKLEKPNHTPGQPSIAYGLKTRVVSNLKKKPKKPHHGSTRGRDSETREEFLARH